MIVLTKLFSYLKIITLEPAVALMVFGMNLILGANIQVDLLMWKICHLELNYSEEICANITNEDYEDIFDEVQTESNNFLMISQWLGGGPNLAYTLFAGSLLDQYGCKPFLIIPVIGLFISFICNIINYAFIESLPLEFFYLDNLFPLLGGKPVFYLAFYAFGGKDNDSKCKYKMIQISIFSAHF